MALIGVLGARSTAKSPVSGHVNGDGVTEYRAKDNDTPSGALLWLSALLAWPAAAIGSVFNPRTPLARMATRCAACIMLCPVFFLMSECVSCSHGADDGCVGSLSLRHRQEVWGAAPRRPAPQQCRIARCERVHRVPALQGMQNCVNCVGVSFSACVARDGSPARPLRWPESASSSPLARCTLPWHFAIVGGGGGDLQAYD